MSNKEKLNKLLETTKIICKVKVILIYHNQTKKNTLYSNTLHIDLMPSDRL